MYINGKCVMRLIVKACSIVISIDLDNFKRNIGTVCCSTAPGWTKSRKTNKIYTSKQLVVNIKKEYNKF